jgi:hypothetical protein
MKYEKPQVVCLDNAVVTIQSTSPKATSMTEDSKDVPFVVTVNAYEADE